MILALVLVLQSEAMGTLLEQFRDEDPAARERATAAVLARWNTWTADDLAALKKAAVDADADVAQRATTCSLRIRFRREAPRLSKFAEVEAALVSHDEAGRLEARKRARDAANEFDMKPGELRVVDEILAAQPWTRLDLVIEFVNMHGVATLADVVKRGLVEPSLRARAIQALGSSRALSYADQVAPFIDDEQPRTRLVSVRALGDMGSRSHADAIARRLGDSDAQVRSFAAYALGELRSRRHAPQVAALLGDAAEGTREMALRALMVMRATSHAADVAKLLQDPEKDVVEAAVKALMMLGGPEDADKLAPLIDSKNSRLRRDAFMALGAIGDPGHAALLVPLLDSQDPQLRGDALRTIADLRGIAQADRVTHCLNDADANVRALALSALVDLEAPLSDDSLAAVLKSDPEQALWALARIGTSGQAKAIEPYFADADAKRRAKAAEAAGGMRVSSFAPVLIKLLSDNAVQVQSAAADALGRIDASAESIKAVGLLLASDRAEVRAAAARALGAMRARELAPRIAPLLGDRSDHVRRFACDALGMLGAVAHFRDLLPLLDDRATRGNACRALSLMDARDSLPALMALLRDDKARFAPIDAIGRLGGPDLAIRLVPLLQDEEISIAVDAARALGRLGNRAIAPFLATAVEERQSPVMVAALGALAQLRANSQTESALRHLDDGNGGYQALQCLSSLSGLPMSDAVREKVVATLAEREPDSLAVAGLIRAGARDAAAQRTAIDRRLRRPPSFNDDILVSALNDRHESETSDLLDKELVLASPVVTADDFRVAFKSAGLALELPAGVRTIGAFSKGSRVTPRRLLEHMEPGKRTLYVDGSTIQLLAAREALQAWRKRMEKK